MHIIPLMLLLISKMEGSLYVDLQMALLLTIYASS